MPLLSRHMRRLQGLPDRSLLSKGGRGYSAVCGTLRPLGGCKSAGVAIHCCGTPDEELESPRPQAEDKSLFGMSVLLLYTLGRMALQVFGCMLYLGTYWRLKSATL